MENLLPSPCCVHMVYEMTPNKIFTHRWLPVDGCIELTGGVPEKVKNLPGLLALNDNGKAADRLFFDLGKFSYKILVTNFVKFNGNGYWLIIKCHFWSHIPKKFLKECQIWPKIVAFITPKITFFEFYSSPSFTIGEFDFGSSSKKCSQRRPT